MTPNDREQHIESLEAKLTHYLQQTEEIRGLSVPQIKDISGADSYHETLNENYLRIGDIAKINRDILNNSFYPKIESEDSLTDSDIDTMRRFSLALNDSYLINSIDCPLVYKLALRLLKEADNTNDDNLRVIALDEVVSASYVMMCMTQRILPVSDVCLEYQKIGLEAAENLLDYLNKDIFSSLSEEAKELAVINARYLRVVSEIDGHPGDPEQIDLLIKRMKYALALCDDPFYRDQLPNYNWSIHEFRTLEYICSLTDYNNEKGLGREDLIFINKCTKRIMELYSSDDPAYKAAHNTDNIDLYCARNSYLVGEISIDEYKERLIELSLNDRRENLTDNLPIIMLQAPFEYLILMKDAAMSEKDREFLRGFYARLVAYMHQTPKMGRLTFLLSYLNLILENYIEIPGGMDFESLCLNLIAALHPPTYVHTLCVADFTSCLTRNLIQKRPDLFIGMQGIENVDDAKAMADGITYFAKHAALCHDFGKLSISETILTYGRDLLDEERRYISVHPSIGDHILSISQGTKKYADIACGHHKWFDNQGGYPEDFDLDSSPYKTIISIVTCADCLDAATDSVGRSYKSGKCLDDLIKEFKEGSGTRYAPFVVDLFDDDSVVEEVSNIIENQRKENYRETYRVLKKYESSQVE